MSAKEILYISLPITLADQIPNFSLDTSIPLPVEVADKENWDISLLQWPAIISGMVTVLAQGGDLREMDYYRRLVLAVHPDIIPTLLTTAELKVSQDEFPFAEELFKALCALEPDSPVHKQNLALFYQMREDRLHKDNEQYGSALKSIQKGDLDKGIALIESFLGKNSHSSNGWFLLGWAQRQKKEWDKALNSFMESYGLLNPPSVELLNEISLCETELGNFDSALSFLNQGLNRDKDNTTLLSNQAMIYLRMNDLSRAEDVINLLKEIDPEDPLVSQFFS